MYNNYFFYPFIPIVPTNEYNTPTLYDLMESIVNYGKDEKTRIKDLAKESRSTIFNFSYPLSENVSKEYFETMILNKFITRRLGFETFTLFQIQLNVRLNEIMPKYNKLFDALGNWQILESGEVVEKVGNNRTDTESITNLTNTAQNQTQNISDRRNSDTPQNQLQEVRNGNYITNYDYDTNNANSSDKSTSDGVSNTNNNNEYYEKITTTPSNKIDIYKQFENVQNIFTLIFKDLSCLFYGLV